ncbi:MAG: PilZ domain-containing protein [SAR324 cluster bacterium]|nr:PilZ domain-containing protein [SAR324 cluster bacterium]
MLQSSLRRRLYDRKLCEITCCLTGTSNSVADVSMVNISQGGGGIVLPEDAIAIDIGKRFRIQLPLQHPYFPVLILGVEVVYVLEKKRAGLKMIYKNVPPPVFMQFMESIQID